MSPKMEFAFSLAMICAACSGVFFSSLRSASKADCQRSSVESVSADIAHLVEGRNMNWDVLGERLDFIVKISNMFWCQQSTLKRVVAITDGSQESAYDSWRFHNVRIVISSKITITKISEQLKSRIVKRIDCDGSHGAMRTTYS